MTAKKTNGEKRPSEAVESEKQRLNDQIKTLDAQLVRQLNRRASLRQRLDMLLGKHQSVAAWLEPCGEVPPKAAMRSSKGPLNAAVMRSLFRQIDHACSALVRPVSVGYLGPEFSYSHLAAIERFGEAAVLTPLSRISVAFEEVAAKRVDFGIVPLENSTDGRIADTLEMLARVEVRICGEVPLSIHHQLLGSGERSKLRVVCSKPQALSQCRAWLGKNLPHVELRETSSTTQAAERAADDPAVAAVASTAAGVHYGLKTLAADIEDNPDNVTRFAVIGLQEAPRTGKDKTALLLQLAHEPGSLADVTSVFKRQKLNMTWIESFPMPKRPQEYLFFFEFEGHEKDLRVRKALGSLRKKTRKLDVLGSYSR